MTNNNTPTCSGNRPTCLITKAGVPYTLDQCRRCWLRLNNPAYAAWHESQANASAPGIIQKAANFAKAAVKHVANAAKTVPPEEAKRRLEICLTCPMKTPDRLACRHPGCGCNLAIKATWESEHCPVGKW